MEIRRFLGDLSSGHTATLDCGCIIRRGQSVRYVEVEVIRLSPECEIHAVHHLLYFHLATPVICQAGE